MSLAGNCNCRPSEDPNQESSIPLTDKKDLNRLNIRLDENKKELETAWANQDLAMIARLEDEQAEILACIRSVTGLGGESRKTGGPEENARRNVAKTIDEAIEKIAEQMCDCGGHLGRFISKGGFPGYDPDPSIEWDVSI